MATSRTGTAQWKAIVKAAKRRAQYDGIERCPHCNTELDYSQGLQHNSAEADHVIPHSKGGQDRIDNVTIMCRACNQSKGNRPSPKAANILQRKPLKTSRKWF